MRTGRGKQLAPEIARRRAAQERLQQALCEYAEALNGPAAARAQVMARYPDLETELHELELDDMLSRMMERFEGAPDPRDPPQDVQDQIAEDAIAEFFARQAAQRQVGSGALSGPYTLATALLAGNVSLHDLAEQSGLGLDVLRALAAGEIAFASADEIPDELLVQLAVAMRVEVEFLIPRLTSVAGAAGTDARAFTAVVRASRQMGRKNKERWLVAAENAKRAAHDPVDDLEIDLGDDRKDDHENALTMDYDDHEPDC